jgi:serine/threonine protein kinase
VVLIFTDDQRTLWRGGGSEDQSKEMGGGISLSGQRQPHQWLSSVVPNQDLKDRYHVNYIIGHGASSCVVQALDQLHDDLPVALKCIPFDVTSSSSFSLEHTVELSLDELKTFKRIGFHPFIVTLHSAFRYKSSCYLAMDYLGGGDLRRYLKLHQTLSEESVAYLLGCIGSALHFLHSQGVIHRDLKPENIAFDLLGRPYLTDFGISAISSDTNPIPISSSSSGTLAYLAPEVLTPTNFHSYQSDFWSLGVIAYELIFQHRPFQKHCPIPMIQFSANEYFSMWTQLHSQATSSPSIDFENIYYNSPKISSQTLLPFPSFSLHLHDDGTLPHQLQIPLPPHSREVSKEFMSMLRGLLDVRIPSRLGNYLKFFEFSNHSFFHKYHFLISSTSHSPPLHQIPSPFASLIDPLTPSSFPSSAASAAACRHGDGGDGDVKFSSDMEQKLLQFYFIRSKFEMKQILKKQENQILETCRVSNSYSHRLLPLHSGHSNSFITTGAPPPATAETSAPPASAPPPATAETSAPSYQNKIK